MRKLLHIIPIYILQGQIIIVHYFSITWLYALFILLVILGFQCQIEESSLHLFSQRIVWFTLLSALFLSILLNLPFLGERAQFFIGKSFLNYYLPGPLKGLLAFALFLFTICLLNYVEAYTLSLRISDYNSTMEYINNSLNQIPNRPLDENLFKDLQGAERQIFQGLPREFPSTGVLKDFSSAVITFIEGKSTGL